MFHLQAEVRRMNPSNKDDKNSSTLLRKAVTSLFSVTQSPYVNRVLQGFAMMKVSYVFSLQEKSITLRLFSNKLCAGRCQLPHV